MRILLLALSMAGIAWAQPDPALEMVEGIKRYLLRQTEESKLHRSPSREELRKIIGVVDPRVAFKSPERIGPVAETEAFGVYSVRWSVLAGMTAEGLLFQPRGKVVARVVALPDADQTPEDFRISQILAASGCQVLSPVLINRDHTWSGNPAIHMTTQPHREFIYRMAFLLGRHIWGFEVQKALAAVDWFASQSPSVPIGVWGYGEGGGVALFAAALDERISVAGVSGYSGPREDLWKEPLYRNVFGILKNFGDTELAGMVAPRTLVSDVEPFLRALGATASRAPAISIAAREASERQHRQFAEMVEFNQALARHSHLVREALWAKTKGVPDPAKLWDEVIGRLPASTLPLNAKMHKAYSGPNWEGYDVTYDVLPDVYGYGVLLLPNGIRPGERRAVVVVQHGLEGRPQHLFSVPETERTFKTYQNIGSKLAELGYVVYLPQNPYVGDFRPINRLANPLGLSLFSFILAQHDHLLDWLDAQPFVDPSRIGFYGLSYGGKTALRVPPLLPRYALSICSGDFNEWVYKVTTVDEPYSYMFTNEWEILEFNLANVANHAEMAEMMAPRPFMVERGHRDGVGVDEWVAFEYAKVKRFYDEMGIGDRTEIEYFNGPHMIHGVGTIAFIQKYLGTRASAK